MSSTSAIHSPAKCSRNSIAQSFVATRSRSLAADHACCPAAVTKNLCEFCRRCWMRRGDFTDTAGHSVRSGGCAQSRPDRGQQIISNREAGSLPATLRVVHHETREALAASDAAAIASGTATWKPRCSARRWSSSTKNRQSTGTCLASDSCRSLWPGKSDRRP